MTEKELIEKIEQLRQIKPRKDWIALTKSRILGQEFHSSIISFRAWKFALACATVVMIFGLFGIAQNSCPGDFLYPVKKVKEMAKVSFAPQQDQPKIRLQLATKRLEELNKIAKVNRVRNLAPALTEFQTNVSQAVKELEATSSDPQLIKEIVDQTQKLKKRKKKVEALGIVVGDSEIEKLDNTLSQLVEKEIKDLEGRTLTTVQKDLLREAKQDFGAGNYSEALIKILNLSQKRE